MAPSLGPGITRTRALALRRTSTVGAMDAMAPPEGGPTVVRKEIRKMSSAEQERFADALEKLFENKDGVPETSEFFRLAGYHGWPGDYCAHRQETFPAWHRAYLVEFERALQAADLALGRDGALGLPYWDWTDASGGEVFPSVLRRRFRRMPRDLLAEKGPGDPGFSLQRQGYSRLYSDASIARMIRRANLRVGVNAALQEQEHWRAASTRWNRGTSIESPHNSVHTMVGFPMTSVNYAAFHPIFFLHHCNVDRIYEKYILQETDSEAEFAAQQAILAEQGERNRYLEPLEPFVNPATGKVFTCADTFRTRPLGYVYDRLPETPPQQMREPPTLAVFEGVDLLAMNGKSYQLHVFVAPRAAAARWRAPANEEEWELDPGYAGMAAIFGGKGTECANCVESGPINIVVDITSALRRLRLARADATLRVVTVDELGDVARREDTPVPRPSIRGPFFDMKTGALKRGGAGLKKGDVSDLQRYLKAFGHYGGSVDGELGPATDAAIRSFQELAGLKVDGVVGPVTKGRIRERRNDTVPDEVGVSDAATYPPGSSITYWVGQSPGYLDRAMAVKEIGDAFAQWASVADVKFSRVEAREAADIEVAWRDQSEGNLFAFDGPGGALAHAKKDFLHLDVSERWLLQGDRNRLGQFFLFPVVLHEIGHCLGLTHSAHAKDVMAPFYVPSRTALAKGDLQRAAALYGPSQGGGSGAAGGGAVHGGTAGAAGWSTEYQRSYGTMRFG